jgi:hypothetical protein
MFSENSKNKNKMKYLFCITGLFFLLQQNATAQYDDSYVSMSTAVISGDPINVVKMSRKDNRIKVKYFACKEGGKLVYNRYNEWAKNKNIIAYSSGTYMDNCDRPNIAAPVGVCFDGGNMVNGKIKDDMDGLVIVYATGGAVASNLKEGNLSVKETLSGKNYNLNLRKPLDFMTFKNWAGTEDATVFQTHLLYYRDQPGVGSNGSPATRERRFLAVCKDEDDNVVHCLVNLAGNNTLYDATTKVADYLKRVADMNSIIFMINLDTGCQDVFQAYDASGNRLPGKGFNGNTSINNASNLLVYYYE